MNSDAAIGERRGLQKGQVSPLRTCIVTRTERPPAELIRFVAAPDGTITPDLARKLPGRGVWVTCDRSVLAAAIGRSAFAKSLKRQVKIPPDLVDQVDRLQLQRTVQALALANKAGLLITGFSKVDSELGKGGVTIVVHAREAAEDGCHKLDRKWRAVAAESGREATVVGELTIAELDLATGRENVVHAGLLAGGATARFSAEAERLARYRSHNSSPAREPAAE